MKKNTITVDGLPSLPDGYNGVKFGVIDKDGIMYLSGDGGWKLSRYGAAYNNICRLIAIPETKIIDMNAAVESGVDCEFNNTYGDFVVIRRLVRIGPLYCDDDSTTWDCCRIRQNHTHYHDGRSKSPIPDGLRVQLFMRDTVADGITGAGSIGWGDVVGYLVLGTAPGYAYEWEAKGDE
jgi:hypothetical protein